MFTLTIDTDNAAFQDFPGAAAEIGRILSKLGADLQLGPIPEGTSDALADANGNTVGRWNLSAEAPTDPAAVCACGKQLHDGEHDGGYGAFCG